MRQGRDGLAILVGTCALLCACPSSEPNGSGVPTSSAKSGADASPPEPKIPIPAGAYVLVPGGVTLRAAPDAPEPFLKVAGQRDGRVFRVVEETAHLVHVESIPAADEQSHCATGIDQLDDFRVRFFVRRDELSTVTTKPVTRTMDDETSVALSPGTELGGPEGLPDGTMMYPVRATGLDFTIELTDEVIGDFYEGVHAVDMSPTETFVSFRERSVPFHAGRLDTDRGTAFARDMMSGLYVYATKPAPDERVLATVRHRCAELQILVDEESTYTITDEDRAKAAARVDESIWGSLGEKEGHRSPAIYPSTPPRWVVKAGTKVHWPDGAVAGDVVSEHEYRAEPQVQGEHQCFEIALMGKGGPGRLCFAAADVNRVPGTSPYRSGDGILGEEPPRLRQLSAEVADGLSRDLVRRITRAHIRELRACYRKGLDDDPQLGGKLTVRFEVEPTGKVGEAGVDPKGTTLDDTAVTACMVDAIKRWKFPKPTTGKPVEVSYPFDLSPT